MRTEIDKKIDALIRNDSSVETIIAFISAYLKNNRFITMNK